MRRYLLLALPALTLACAEGGGTRRATVTPGGGVLTSADGLFSLEIPEGALAKNVAVAITMRAEAFKGTDLSSRVYEVSPLQLVPGAAVKVRYRAPRTAWVGQRTIATFDEGFTEPAREANYDHLEHVASAVYGSFERRLFGLATIVAVTTNTPCSTGCPRYTPGCLIDPVAFAADHCPIDGWNDQPNTGTMFVISQVAIAPRERGFDVDGRCKSPDDCVDNALSTFGQFANDQIRQALLGGENLMLVELAGLEHPGDLVADIALTVKFYEGEDFDDPFFPANNFQVPGGDTRCCEFLIQGGSLEGAHPQARARIAAKLEAGAVSTLEVADTGLWGSLPALSLFGVETSTANPKGALRNAQVSLHLEVDERYNVTHAVNGLLGGVILARDLAAVPSPYCKTRNNVCMSPESRVIDLLLDIVGRPDIDVGGDGLEAFRTGPDGLVVECLDGDGSVIPPVDPARPASCAESPRVDDGYSVAYTFEGVAAKVKGVSPAR